MADVQAQAGDTADANQNIMPLMEHLKELRTRLIRAFIALFITTGISFAFAKQVFVILKAPIGEGASLQSLTPTETLGSYMKVALLCGVILAMPVIVYQIGRFIMPGLTKKERRYLFLLVPGATLFFVAGVAFAYFVMMPAAMPFLQGFLSDVVDPNWAVGKYLSFVTSLLFWIGVAFELPLVIYFLAKLGIVNAEMLTKNRKYAIVIMAVMAAVITPTVDPLNMILVMGPLIVLYELGVILAKIA
jgi:sec-independent protein translocase protein TatC